MLKLFKMAVKQQSLYRSQRLILKRICNFGGKHLTAGIFKHDLTTIMEHLEISNTY